MNNEIGYYIVAFKESNKEQYLTTVYKDSISYTAEYTSAMKFNDVAIAIVFAKQIKFLANFNCYVINVKTTLEVVENEN